MIRLPIPAPTRQYYVAGDLARLARVLGAPFVFSGHLPDPIPPARLFYAASPALRRGVFGSPTCAVGDELFWGSDRLWLLEQYLCAGERYEGLEPQARRALSL